MYFNKHKIIVEFYDMHFPYPVLTIIIHWVVVARLQYNDARWWNHFHDIASLLYFTLHHDFVISAKIIQMIVWFQIFAVWLFDLWINKGKEREYHCYNTGLQCDIFISRSRSVILRSQTLNLYNLIVSSGPHACTLWAYETSMDFNEIS